MRRVMHSDPEPRLPERGLADLLKAGFRRTKTGFLGAGRAVTWVTVGVLLGLGSYVVVAESLNPDTGFAAERFAPVQATAFGAQDLSDGVKEVARMVTPSVVRIETQRAPAVASGSQRIPEGPFQRFFEFPFPDGLPRPEGPQVSGGTGFIVSEDGYILTNNHVIQGAENITVWLSDRRSFEGEIVGSDPTTDVAVVKIPERGLQALAFGDSDRLEVGEWVVAVGNPGFQGRSSLDHTVTVGIVSAIGRPLRLLSQQLRESPDGEALASWAIEDFIQTDAVINPGNSGGPLVGLDGEVIGINSAIASSDGYYQGYGFAIPINLAARVMGDLIEYGEVRRAWLGVRMSDVSAEDAEVYGLDRIYGVVVQDVTPGGPADEAGLRQEDVIVAIEGQPVERSGHLQQLVARQAPNDEVEVSIYRDGSERTVEVTLGQVPLSGIPTASRDVRIDDDAGALLGITVAELNGSLARSYGFERPGGVVVTDVERFGPAARRGIGPGVRLVEVNDERIGTLSEFNRALAEVDAGDVVSLRLETAEGDSRVVNLRARD